MIEAEDAQMKLMAETIEKIKEEKDTSVAEIKTKTMKERQALANLEAEADTIEQATTKLRGEAVHTEEQLRKDILLVETMLEEVRQKLNSSQELRNYQIPNYPFPEELVRVTPMLAVEPSSAHDSPGRVAHVLAMSAGKTVRKPMLAAARKK
jgi:hypothetical protein